MLVSKYIIVALFCLSVSDFISAQNTTAIGQPRRQSQPSIERNKVQHRRNKTVSNGTSKFIFRNGTYVGQAEHNIPNGEGQWSAPDGSLYVGDWKNGLRNGTGTQYYPNGSIQYYGDWENDFYNGQGTFTDVDGSSYAGEWLKGKKHGNGVSFRSDGSIEYKCIWVNGVLNGWGTQYNSDGTIFFSGEWKDGKYVLSKDTISYKIGGYSGTYIGLAFNGMPQEKGVFIYDDGRKYDGEWKDGVMEGDGVLYNHDGTIFFSGKWSDGKYILPEGSISYKVEKKKGIYVGTLLNNIPFGHGTFTMTDNSKYVGDWDNGIYNGNGVLYRTDGSQYYIGEFKNGKFNGHGTLFYIDGRKYEGDFKDGKINGKGVEYRPDGSKFYEGEWKNGKMNGFGIKYNNDGEIRRQGQWDDNIPIR